MATTNINSSNDHITFDGEAYVIFNVRWNSTAQNENQNFTTIGDVSELNKSASGWTCTGLKVYCIDGNVAGSETSSDWAQGHVYLCDSQNVVFYNIDSDSDIPQNFECFGGLENTDSVSASSNGDLKIAFAEALNNTSGNVTGTLARGSGYNLIIKCLKVYEDV